MLQTLTLLLPALLPSWRFFDEIAPSPRIEFALTAQAESEPDQWREFRPRPERLPIAAMLKRMLWNPHWNESLFLVSCAERLVDQETEHSRSEIFSRIAADLRCGGDAERLQPYLRYRLTFLYRESKTVEKHILYLSDAARWREGDAP